MNAQVPRILTLVGPLFARIRHASVRNQYDIRLPATRRHHLVDFLVPNEEPCDIDTLSYRELGRILINDSQERGKVIQGSERSLAMARYDLTYYEWKVIQPLLPNKTRGVPRVDDRRVLNGIFWVLRSGAPWADVPERYGPPTTIYNRFNRWRKAGVWDRLMEAVIAAHDGKVQMIDSTSVRVHQQAAAQKNTLEALVSVEAAED